MTAGDSCTINGNTVVGGVVCSGGASVISNNNIQGDVTGGTITGNTILSLPVMTYEDTDCRVVPYPIDVYVTGNVVSNNNITNGTIKATQTITSNVVVSGTRVDDFRVFGGLASPIEDTAAIIATGSLTISGNTITGGGTYKSYPLGQYCYEPGLSTVPAIDVTGANAAIISNNVITGRGSLAISGVCSLISNNNVKGDIQGSVSSVLNNAVNGAISLTSSAWTVDGNTALAISVSSGRGSITDNTVINGTIGRGITVCAATATIENNYVSGNGANITQPLYNGGSASGLWGISVTNGTATISNNTITNNSVGIDIYGSSSITINYNNIQNNGYSVILEPGMSSDVNATYNWWGTTDAQAIGQSIHDSKNDFNPGTVTTSPALTDCEPSGNAHHTPAADIYSYPASHGAPPANIHADLHIQQPIKRRQIIAGAVFFIDFVASRVRGRGRFGCASYCNHRGGARCPLKEGGGGK